MLPETPYFARGRSWGHFPVPVKFTEPIHGEVHGHGLVRQPVLWYIDDGGQQVPWYHEGTSLSEHQVFIGSYNPGLPRNQPYEQVVVEGGLCLEQLAPIAGKFDLGIDVIHFIVHSIHTYKVTNYSRCRRSVRSFLHLIATTVLRSPCPGNRI